MGVSSMSSIPEADLGFKLFITGEILRQETRNNNNDDRIRIL